MVVAQKTIKKFKESFLTSISLSCIIMIFLTLSLNAAVVGRVGAGAVDDRVGDAAEVLLELEEGDSAPVRGREDGVNTQTQVQVSADCLYVSPGK